jgi:adenylosuccinate synthase
MVLLRYAARINGLTELALTKLDVLTGLDPLCIGVAYRHPQAAASQPAYEDLPLGPGKLTDYEPVYEELPGWSQDLPSVRRWEHLPPQARAYILRIEELSGVPVRLVSVGPERDQIVEVE